MILQNWKAYYSSLYANNLCLTKNLKWKVSSIPKKLNSDERVYKQRTF